MEIRGFEDAPVFKIREAREQDLRTDVGDLQFAQDQSEMLGGSGAAHGTVADDAGGFVRPFGFRGIERVFERSAHRVVVFGDDEDEAVELGKRLLLMRCGGGVGGFAKQGKLEFFDVEDFIIRVAAEFGLFENPGSDLRADASFAGAAENDADVELIHDGSSSGMVRLNGNYL